MFRAVMHVIFAVAFVDLAMIQARSNLMCDPDSACIQSDRTQIGADFDCVNVLS